MNIILVYNTVKTPFKTRRFQSVNSILCDFLKKEDASSSHFLTYHGSYLAQDTCLEKYGLGDGAEVEVSVSKKGGDFFSYISQNPMGVFIAILIALLPIFILPAGFIPLTSSLIKVIMESATAKIGEYLLCVLGKRTLFKRMNLVISVVKYFIFILMIYTVITFPLIILCATLKGQSIMDDPANLCSPVSTATLTGMILTSIFLLIYITLRSGNYVIHFFIDLFKKVEFLNISVNPILFTSLTIFDSFKYIPFFFLPFVGAGLASYFISLNVAMRGIKSILKTVDSVGCRKIVIPAEFKKALEMNLKLPTGLSDEERKKNCKLVSEKVKILWAKMGLTDKNLPKNMMDEKSLEKKIINVFGKTDGINPKDFPFFKNAMGRDDAKGTSHGDGGAEEENNIEMTEISGMSGGFFENRSFRDEDDEDDEDDDDGGSIYGGRGRKEKKSLLPRMEGENVEIESRKLDKRNRRETILTGKEKWLCKKELSSCCHPRNFILIADTLKNLLETGFVGSFAKDNGIYIIFGMFIEALYEGAVYYITDNNIEFMDPSNQKMIESVHEKIDDLKDSMEEYSRQNGAVYTRYHSIFKTIFKKVFLNIYCNISQTSHSSLYVISQMGEVNELIDMLKAGSASGILTAIFYIIAVIVLIICGIFGVF